MSKSLSEFTAWARARGVVANPNGSYPGQCVSLIQQCLNQCYDVPYKGRGNAKDFIPPKFHQKRRRKTAYGKAHKKSMRQTRDHRERQQTVHDGGYQKPRTWAKSQKLVCAICQRPLTLETAEVDHIKPLCLGGDNHPRNFQISCHQCHKIKTVGDNLWINLKNQDVSRNG